MSFIFLSFCPPYCPFSHFLPLFLPFILMFVLFPPASPSSSVLISSPESVPFIHPYVCPQFCPVPSLCLNHQISLALIPSLCLSSCSFFWVCPCLSFLIFCPFLPLVPFLVPQTLCVLQSLHSFLLPLSPSLSLHLSFLLS